jgi:hypothetical protein
MAQQERPPDEPTNLFEWLWRLKRYEKGIFVRQKVEEGGDFTWVNLNLAELDPKTWAEYVARWLEEGRLPVRVKEPEEIGE